ncbi:MAG TPA: hypothetical protein VIZ86_16760 [Pseudomonas sp.]
MIPNEGRDYIAAVLRKTEAPADLYVFLLEGNYVPDANAKAAELQLPTMAECTAYSEAARPLWPHSYEDGVIHNLDAKVTFTPTQAKRVYAAGIVTAPTKGGTGGKILHVARFETPKDMVVGEPFTVANVMNLIPTAL